MKLYLDDDIVASLLIQALHKAGHDVRIPADLGLSGAHDAIHLMVAIREERVCLSRNYRDFQILHSLLEQAGGHHSGILIVRRDDPTRRNMAPHDIVRALRNLEAANIPIADQYIILNAWQ